MENLKKCTIYIDEAGDLGCHKGTRWFVLSAVIIDKDNESSIRDCIKGIKQRLNINEIHFRKIKELNRRAFIVRELSRENFTYLNIIIDTDKLNTNQLDSISTYNYACKLALERASWFLRDTKRVADIVLSARGTSRDQELIDYICKKLFPYPDNNIDKKYFNRVMAKQANGWDMLQVADVCATSMFLSYEINKWGFITPCFAKVLKQKLYIHQGKVLSYGIKYFNGNMSHDENMRNLYPCYVCDTEKAPGATSTGQACW